MNQQSIRWGATCAAALFALSACGANGSGATASTGSKSGAAGLKVGTTSLGRVLVDSKGMTVYMLTSDQKGKSNCPGPCLTYWPPVGKLPTATKPAGVTGAVSSTTDTAGDPIATVGGWPLYYYVKDRAPGDVTGQGVKSFGGVWWVLSPSGKPVTTSVPKSSANKSSTNSSSNTGGY